MTRSRRFATLAMLTLSPVSLSAAAVPVSGTEIEVSEAGSAPSVAMLPSGEFAVAWVVRAAYARVYSARGEARGPAFLLSEDATQFAAGVQLAGSSRGGFVATWAGNIDEGQGSARVRILARQFDRFGALLGPPFAVSSATEWPPGAQEFAPTVGMDDEGRFVVAWEPDRSTIVARLFDRNAMAQGPNFQVHADGDARGAHIAMQPKGTFLVCWSTNLGGQLVAGARARLFDRDAAPLSSDLTLNTAAGQQGCTDATADRRGGYKVVWAGRMGAERGFFARGIDARGRSVGEPVRLVPFEPVPAPPVYFFAGGALAATSAGRLLFVWAGLDLLDSADSTWGVRARAFSDALWPRSPPFEVNQPVAFGLFQPSVSCNPSAMCVVAWQWEWDPNQDEHPKVLARRIQLRG
ncbi:MAG: hypothetical protein ABI689_10895 [Thermoanaerobaculia bacterium]